MWTRVIRSLPVQNFLSNAWRFMKPNYNQSIHDFNSVNTVKTCSLAHLTPAKMSPSPSALQPLNHTSCRNFCPTVNAITFNAIFTKLFSHQHFNPSFKLNGIRSKDRSDIIETQGLTRKHFDRKHFTIFRSPELARDKDTLKDKEEPAKSDECKPKYKSSFFKPDKKFECTVTPDKKRKWTSKKRGLFEKHDFLTRKKIFSSKGKSKKPKE